MPRQAVSGVKYLLRRKRPGVPLSRTPWSGRYKGHEVILGRWGDGVWNPLDQRVAIIVLQRFMAAVDDGTFNSDGEVHPLVPAPCSDDIHYWHENAYADGDTCNCGAWYRFADRIGRAKDETGAE